MQDVDLQPEPAEPTPAAPAESEKPIIIRIPAVRAPANRKDLDQQLLLQRVAYLSALDRAAVLSWQNGLFTEAASFALRQRRKYAKLRERLT